MKIARYILLSVSGAGLIIYGAWLMYPPAAFCLGGIFDFVILANLIRVDRRSSDVQENT